MTTISERNTKAEIIAEAIPLIEDQAEQIQDLKREFVEFKLNEMSHEDMYAWIRDVYMYELDKCTEDEVREEIDSYDENLYEVLAPYVLDMEGSWEAMQEFIHDRHATEWIYD